MKDVGLEDNGRGRAKLNSVDRFKTHSRDHRRCKDVGLGRQARAGGRYGTTCGLQVAKVFEWRAGHRHQCTYERRTGVAEDIGLESELLIDRGWLGGSGGLEAVEGFEASAEGRLTDIKVQRS